MTGNGAAATKWRQYRQVLLGFWSLFAVSATCIFLGTDTAIVASLVTLGVGSFAVAFWPCPHCGERVGYIPVGPLMLLWPFGGWCTTCGRRLFLQR
jgi:hypothetical protein